MLNLPDSIKERINELVGNGNIVKGTPESKFENTSSGFFDYWEGNVYHQYENGIEFIRKPEDESLKKLLFLGNTSLFKGHERVSNWDLFIKEAMQKLDFHQIFNNNLKILYSFYLPKKK